MNQEKRTERKSFWLVGWPLVTLVIGAVIGAILSLVGGAFLGPMFHQQSSITRPADFVSYEHGGNILSVYNDRGELMVKNWYIPMGIDTAFVAKFDPKTKPQVVLGTSDGRVFVINPNTLRRHTISEEDGFQLLVDSVLEGHNHSNRFRINEIGILDWDGDGTKEIFVSSVDVHWYPARLVVLDKDTNVLYEYWNSGGIVRVLPVDIDKDGADEMVVRAYNNEQRKKFHGENPQGFFLLDGSHPSGQLPDSVYRFYPADVTEWYFLWTGPRNPATGPGSFEIEYIRRDGETEPEVRLGTQIGLSFHIDKDGNITKVTFADDWFTEANQSLALKTPEPWLLKLERKDGKVIEDTVFIKQQLIETGWLK